jgi:hypothetical protein
MYELFTRARAYDGLYLGTEEIATRAGNNELRPALPDVWPDEVKSLCARSRAHDPAARPEFKEIAPELMRWRSDEQLTTLKGIAKGAKRGILEKLSSVDAMLKTSFADSVSALSQRGGPANAIARRPSVG